MNFNNPLQGWAQKTSETNGSEMGPKNLAEKKMGRLVVLIKPYLQE